MSSRSSKEIESFGLFFYQKLGNSRKFNGLGCFFRYQKSGNSTKYYVWDCFLLSKVRFLTKSWETHGNQMIWVVFGYQKDTNLKEVEWFAMFFVIKS